MSDGIAVVTGASGHLGANLVRALVADGRRVRALVRRDLRALEGLDVETVEGDLFDPASLERAFHGAECVFNAAGRISITGPDGGLVERTNVDGVKTLVRACRAAGVHRLVHVSSIHAFQSEPQDVPIDETRPLALDGRVACYDRSKAMGQIVVLDADRDGLSTVVVNPTAILGPCDYKPSRMGAVLLDIAQWKLPALVDGGFNWVDARDVAAGAMAAERQGRSGHCYLLSGHWVHICDLSAIVGRTLGRRTPRLATPRWIAGPASYVSLGMGRMTGKTPKFTPEAIRALHRHRLISHQKASAELGYAPRPIEETVRDTLDWFRKAGMLKA